MKLLRFTDPTNINKFYIYKNNYFVQKNKKKKILEYNENFDESSDDLTAMHEK